MIPTVHVNVINDCIVSLHLINNDTMKHNKWWQLNMINNDTNSLNIINDI